MLQFLQSLVPKELIKVLDDGNPTVLPAWDPMVWFITRAFDRCIADFSYTGLARVINRCAVEYFFHRYHFVYLTQYDFPESLPQ